jgi:uncharacterized protein (TIGR03437 family)
MKRLHLALWLAVVVFLRLPARAQVTVVGSKYAPQRGLQVAPGQVVTVLLTGLKTVFPASAPVQRATTVPLPTQLAGISAAVQQTGTSSRALPVLAVQQIDQCALTDNSAPTPDCVVTALSVQIPSDLVVPNPLAESPFVLVSQLMISENGATSRSFNINPVTQNVHIVTTCDLITGNNTNTACTPIISHADGKLVSTSSPAIADEVLVVYSVGLGATSPLVPEGQASPNPPATLANPVGLGFTYANPISVIESPPSSSAATPQPQILFAGLAPTMVGIYQMNLRVPQPTTAASSCSSGGVPNLTLTLQGSGGSADQAVICVDLSASASLTATTPSTNAATLGNGISSGTFVPQTIWFPVGADLTSLGQPLPPGTTGVHGPNHE